MLQKFKTRFEFGFELLQSLENLIFSVERFDQSPRLCGNPEFLTSRKKRKSAFRYFRGSDTGLATLMTFNSWKCNENQNKILRRTQKGCLLV